MTGSRQPAEAQERLDELRRRLYRDGATAEDLRRFTEQQALLVDESESPAAPGAPPAPRRRRLVPAAVVGLLLVAVVGVAVSLRPSTDARPTTAPADAALVVQDIGDGQTMLTAKHAVSAPRRVGAAVDGVAAVGERFQGTGDAVVQLHADDASFDGGRVLVSLSSAEASPIAWRALRRASRMDWSSYWEVVGRGTVSSRAGVPSPTVFAYRLAPPTRIAIEAPEGLRWTLEVALAAGSPPTLH